MFISQEHIKLIKSDSKDIYLQIIFILNKCCFFLLFIHQTIQKKMHHVLHKNIKQLSCFHHW